MTEAEADFLRQHYESRGAAWCAEQLGLSLSQIGKRQHALGLYRRRRWTERDDATLRILWGRTLPTIAKRMGRTENTIYWRAQKLGLGLGVPQGCVYLTELARQAGFDTTTLRMILRWAEVGVQRAIARPSAKRRGEPGAGRVTYFVDHGDGLEAVDRWLAAEYVDPAAKARGLYATTLKRWLIAAGHEPPKKPRAKWRVPTTIIDQVVADRLPRIGRWGAAPLAQEAA